MDEARRAGSYVMAHAYMDEAIRRCVRLGVATIEHASHLDDRTCRDIAAGGATIVPTLAACDARAGDPGEAGPLFAGVLDASRESLGRARHSGRHRTRPRAAGNRPRRQGDAAQWRRSLDVNLSCVSALVHAAPPRLGAGSGILVVSSTAAFDHSPIGGADYTASKLGPNWVVRHLGDDLGPLGIRINSVWPGLLDTPMGRTFMS